MIDVHNVSRFILDTVRKDIYVTPSLPVYDIGKFKEDDLEITVYRLKEEYEVIIVQEIKKETFNAIYSEMIQNPIKIKNLEVDYCRNIYLEVFGCCPIEYEGCCPIEYEDCIFTNPHNLPIRDYNCRDCYYLRKG